MSRKNALVKGAGGYEIDNDATIQIKDRRPNRHEGVLRRTRGEKIVAKVTIIWAGGPTGDGAEASGKDLDFNVSGIRDLNPTRAN